MSRAEFVTVLSRLAAINAANYGYTCIEVEDKAFEGSKDRVEASLILSKRYMEQFVI